MKEISKTIQELYKNEEYAFLEGNTDNELTHTLSLGIFQHVLNYMSVQRLIAMCELIRATDFEYNKWKKWYDKPIDNGSPMDSIEEYIKEFHITIIRVDKKKTKLLPSLVKFYNAVVLAEILYKGNQQKQEQYLNDYSRFLCRNEVLRLEQLSQKERIQNADIQQFQKKVLGYFKKLYYAPNLKNVAIENEFLQMLRPERFRKSSLDTEDFENRNPFESDYFRVVTSAPIRRLQDKTQIFPQEKSDFVRRRLTHSMEVAAIGRQLGRMVEERLITSGALFEAGDYVKKYSQSIATILETAGLVHDIGNPPFGHFGEDTIQRYFTELIERHKVEKKLEAAQIKITKAKNKENEDTVALSISKILLNERQDIGAIAKAFSELKEDQQEDFTRFDGNVQGLRILRHLGLSADHNSFNLTMPTMAAIIKYPHPSKHDCIEGDHSSEKYGYYQKEKDTYETICEILHLQKGKRHPLAYLLEAADDIVNVTSDVEDGCKMGIIGFNDLKNRINKLKDKNLHFGTISKYITEQATKGNCSVGTPDELVIKEFRIRAVHALVEEAVDVFVKNIYDIIYDSYASDTIDLRSKRQNSILGNELLAKSKLRNALRDMQEMTYQDTYVLKSELLGEHVISTMLDKFIGCMFSENVKADKNGKLILKSKSAEGKLYALISSNYKRAFNCAENEVPAKTYDRFLLAVDHVSGMTDSYIVDLYNELTNSRF